MSLEYIITKVFQNYFQLEICYCTNNGILVIQKSPNCSSKLSKILADMEHPL